MNRGEETRFYKIADACNILGIKEGILRKWDLEGKIKTIRTPGGIRLFDISSFDPATADNFNSLKAKKEPIVIFYSRVSSNKQKDDLNRQKEYIKDSYTDKYTKCEEITDIGSGINFKRPGLLRILGLIKQGNISTVVVASKDRLARFGFELIEWLCKEYGTKIVVFDTPDTTEESELGTDLMSIVQVYCCRWNGRRRYKTKNKDTKTEAESNTGTEVVT